MTGPSSKPLRLFFAVPVTDEVRAAAAALMGELSAFGADANWVKPENLHLTLRFLGSTPPRVLPELNKLLDGAAHGRSPFSVEFDRLGHFGSKVVWAGVSEGGEALKSLAHALGAETRDFVAHLTLARIKTPRSAKRLLTAVAAAAPLHWPCPVARVDLYSSRTTAAGPVYESVSHRVLGD